MQNKGPRQRGRVGLCGRWGWVPYYQDTSMSRQDANAAFALTSFLYGSNAGYIEDLYSRFERDPKTVDADWQAFFKGLKEDASGARRAERGPSWKSSNWPLLPRGELVSALDGDWAEVEKRVGEKVKAGAQAQGVEISTADVQQATRDSIHALMLIRAYRARGHLHARLDPLELERPRDQGELDPRSYGFSEADYDRRIYL